MALEAKIYDDVAQKQALKEAKLMIFFVVSNTCECGKKHRKINFRSL